MQAGPASIGGTTLMLSIYGLRPPQRAVCRSSSSVIWIAEVPAWGTGDSAQRHGGAASVSAACTAQTARSSAAVHTGVPGSPSVFSLSLSMEWIIYGPISNPAVCKLMWK
jgi:hypothetical protein